MSHHNCNGGFMKSKYAFTLAEVLVTLGIIGVVAALTMPALIANYQKHVAVNKLKKAYTIISQFVQKAEEDNGSMYDWNDLAPSTGSAYDKAFYMFNTYIKPYFNVLSDSATYGKKVGREGTDDYLRYILDYKGGKNVFKTMESTSFSGVTSNILFMTNDGFLFGFDYHQTSCFTNYHCYYMIVDINGSQKPNVAGKDVFRFAIYAGKSYTKVLPVYKTSSQSCDNFGVCKPIEHKCGDVNYCKGSGHNCTCLIFENGWQMPADYPW